MAHVIRLMLVACMSILGGRGHTKLWESHESDQQFGDNESTAFKMSQRLRKEVNTRIHKVSALEPGLAKIIETVCISRYFENFETDHHMAVISSCVDYIDTGLSRGVYPQSKTQTSNRSPTYDGCANTSEFNNAVA